MKAINHHILVIAACIISLCGFAAAQKTGPSPTPTPERNREIVALLNDARLAAPELGVDTFLKVVESNKVADPVWKREILDEAIRMSDGVGHPVQLSPVLIRGVRVNMTDAGYLGGAYAQEFDGLNFKARAIRAMLSIEKERAKSLVFEIGGELNLKPRTCEDTLVYRPDGIYDAVAEFTKAYFTEKQIAEGQRALFLVPWFENLRSPSQIAPAFKLLVTQKGPASEMQILTGAFFRAIDRNFDDDRSFSAYASNGLVVANKNMNSDLSEVIRMQMPAFRSSMIKNLRASRCVDNEIPKGDAPPIYIQALNKMFPERPLTEDELKPSELKGTAKPVDLSTSVDFREITKELFEIKGVGSDNKIVELDKTNPEWQAKVTTFIDKIHSWQSREEMPETITFALRSNLFLSVLESVPDPALRKEVIRKWLRFMSGSPMQKDKSYILWHSQFWMVMKSDPEMFIQLSAEFPNHNFRVMRLWRQLTTNSKARTESPS